MSETSPPNNQPDNGKVQERPEYTKAQKRLIMTALMMSVALAALDVTIVATAMPTIVSSLSGMAMYAWLVTIYLLTSTTSTPIYGQLADNLGRKPILIFGILLFVSASILCAQAKTMTELIVFRGIQGLGAGAILPMTMTIIGDLFTIKERAHYQAVFSGVWGVSSIVGPALGAFILTFWSWHGIFYINLPIGMIALILVTKFYHEQNVSRHRYVDVWGGLLMTCGVAALLIALERKLPLGAMGMILYLVALTCFLLLFPVEKRVARPFLPIGLITRRIIGVSYLVAFFGGMVQFGTSAFMPLFVQGAMGGTPTSVGLTMAPVAIGWPLGSVLSGRMILKMGYKRVLAIGMTIGVIATSTLLLMTDITPLPVVMAIVAFIGLSMGLTATPVIIAVQNAVEWNQRGIATALNMFHRSIGGVMGVAFMGAILNARLSSYLSGSTLTGGVKAQDLVNDLLDPLKRGNYNTELLHAVRHDLSSAMHVTYVLPLIAAIIALGLIVFAFPGGKVEKHAADGKG